MGVSSVKVSDNAEALSTNRPKNKKDETSSADMQNNFLKLLTAQMNNQDPTNPMDNAQLTSQLAQISSLSGIEKLNSTLNKVSGQIGDSLSMSTSNMIGRGVMVPGNKILVASSSSNNSDDSEAARTTTPFGVELPRNADSVVVSIKNSSGNVVRTLDLGQVPTGTNSFSWDGKFDNDLPAPDGSYTYTVSATSNKEPIPATSLFYSVVYGVIKNSGDKGVLLDLGIAGTASVNDVRQIL